MALANITLDNALPMFHYAGVEWQHVVEPSLAYHNATTSIARNPASTVSFVIDSVAFSIFGDLVNTHSSFAVSIDNVDQGTYSAFGYDSPTNCSGEPSRLYSSPLIPQAAHEVIITVLEPQTAEQTMSGFAFDYLEIQPGPPKDKDVPEVEKHEVETAVVALRTETIAAASSSESLSKRFFDPDSASPHRHFRLAYGFAVALWCLGIWLVWSLSMCTKRHSRPDPESVCSLWA